jgi:hypothetical protein
MPADCGRCRRPGRGISMIIPSSTCSNRFSRWSSRSSSLAWSESDYMPPPAVGWDLEFESGSLQQRVCELSVPERRDHFPARTP